MKLSYPPTRTSDVTERLAGVEFDDPYRWLEENTDEVREWQQSQADLADAYVREWPHFDRLRSEVAKYSTPRFAALPRCSAGSWFRQDVPEGASRACVVVSDQPFGDGRILFDPTTEDASRPPFISWISPSPDAMTLAIGVCSDGSEQNTIRLIDVATGELLDNAPEQILMDNWTGGAQWLADSSGFFFSAIHGKPTDFTPEVFLHRRGDVPVTGQVSVPWTTDDDYRAVVVSADGSRAVALERLTSTIPVAVADLHGGGDELLWEPFVNDVDGTVKGRLVGDRFIAVTDIGAPHGRVVAIDLGSPDPNDPTTWHELVPQSEAVIRAVTVVGDSLYVAELVDTYARVRVVDHTGAFVLPLPGYGALGELPFPMMGATASPHPSQFLFAFSSLTSSWGIYSHHPGADTIVTVQHPDVSIPDAVVEDRWATSPDGTRVPFHLVHLNEVDISVPQPTLLYAYGGFNAAWIPQFPGAMAAFVAAGGVFVHGHLRGGAELGADWWAGGRLKNKQNGYADLFAIAEDLIDAGNTTPAQLAVTGASNGGLMAGVAATQRPDLWAAAIPRVPLLDLIGAFRDGYGRVISTIEFGDPEDPEEVRRIASFSPYHLVEQGRDYPAIYLDAGATDPRCPAWHSRKFGARLQASTSGETPVLLRIWDNVGHGWATDKEIALTQDTEWLAFAMRELGIEPRFG